MSIRPIQVEVILYLGQNRYRKIDVESAYPNKETVSALGAVHKVRHAIFGQFLPPPPVTLCHTSQDPPKVCHASRTPRFLVGLVQKSWTKVPCTNSISIVRGGFCPGGFVRVGFCPFPLLSQHICYNRKLNITLNFMFHMYDKNLYKRDVTWSSSPPPVTNCHTYSDPLTLSSVRYFMDGPFSTKALYCTYTIIIHKVIYVQCTFNILISYGLHVVHVY